MKGGVPVCDDCVKLPLCLCGRLAYKKKGGLHVCQRCDKIEHEMYGRRRVMTGMKKFPNHKQYETGEAVETY